MLVPCRTKLQYESLEGSMILDDANDDTLSDKIGCPLYTAPELLCPQPTYHGKPADMWSLGVILYTMLVGQYPFYEKGNCNLITVIRHGNVHIPLSLSKSVRWLILSLLKKNYTERMTAMHIFLAPWLKDQRPFHVYLPITIEITEDLDDNDNNHDGLAMDVAINHKDIGVEPEPLDYTRRTLQIIHASSLPADVDLG
ncbi:tribbles isoform X2 [Scaptodrosophila lebanonensis]|uniref:Tribbles isoform X2 n=1 Tax=Drosophila lebanonensis TaxID=7225 RepID=A0A6J2TYP5_DROLE|nr:tribbles isoform X2 [Scaptodrosophila lebanonensis]